MMYEDILLAQYMRLRNKSKHIAVCLCFASALIESGQLILIQCALADNIAELGNGVCFHIFGCVFPDPQLGARMCISRLCRLRTHGPETNLAALKNGLDCQRCYPVARKRGVPPLFRCLQEGRRCPGGTQVLRIKCPQKVWSFIEKVIWIFNTFLEYSRIRGKGGRRGGIYRGNTFGLVGKRGAVLSMLQDRHRADAVDITFQITYTFWDSVFFGIPWSPRT